MPQFNKKRFKIIVLIVVLVLHFIGSVIIPKYFIILSHKHYLLPEAIEYKRTIN